MAPALLPAGHHASIYECRVRHRPWEQLQLGSTDSSFPFAVCLKDSSKRLRSTRSCTSPTQALPLAEVLYSCRYSALLPKDSSAQLRSSRLPSPPQLTPPPPPRMRGLCIAFKSAARGAPRSTSYRTRASLWHCCLAGGAVRGHSAGSKAVRGKNRAQRSRQTHPWDHTALLIAPLVVRPL